MHCQSELHFKWRSGSQILSDLLSQRENFQTVVFREIQIDLEFGLAPDSRYRTDSG